MLSQQTKILQLNCSHIIWFNIFQSLTPKLYNNIKPVMCDLWRSRRNRYNNITVTFLL